METVSIVNDEDNVIGETTIDEAHDKKLLHRIIHIIIRNSKGDIMIVKRQGGYCAGLWDISVGGHVSAGESYEQAAKREIVEEAGVNAPIKFAFKFVNKPRAHSVSCFTAECDGPFKFNDESSEQKFAGKEEIKKM
ncbi:MAG: NUDIX domain-containing protein, partial [Candidatus Micrarchaeota archaeon]